VKGVAVKLVAVGDLIFSLSFVQNTVMSHGVVGESTARAMPRAVGERSHERGTVHVLGRSQSRDLVASLV